jgi:hypothetical protein
MNLLKKIPFFLFLLVLFFCLHGSVENYGYLNMYEVAKVGFTIIACIVVFFVIVWLFSKNYVFASLLTFFICLWYLFFGAIHDVIKSVFFLHFLESFTILLPVLLVANIALIWWLKKNKQLHQKMMLYLNVLFLFFCVADGVLLISKHFSYKEQFINPVTFNKSKVSQKPNVYFLLFDEYAGYNSLRDSFNFKNDSLYTFLRQQKFKELPTHSNYDFTPFSMASIINLQYVPQNYNTTLLTQPDIQHRFGEIRNGQIFSFFKSIDYDIKNYSVFDIKDYPALNPSNGLFPIHTALLTNKIFHNRLMKGIGWKLLTGKYAIPFLQNYFLYKGDKYNKDVETSVLNNAGEKNNNPKFCYAHFMLPHGEYFRDSTGALNPPDLIMNNENFTSKSLYLSYLKYTNNIIKKLVNNIAEKDPQSVVIIMSDHGFYDYKGVTEFDPYNFDNICFLRLPDNMSYAPDLPTSNVNFFRYLLNSGFGQNLPFLKDSIFNIVEDPVILR